MEAYDQQQQQQQQQQQVIDSKEASLVDIIDSAQRKLLKLQYPQQLAQHTAALLGQQPTPVTPGRARKQRVIPQRPREIIWSGELEWIEKEKHDQPNVIRQIPCSIASNLENSKPEMLANNWPTRLSLQLLPKPVAQNIHSHYFKNSKSVYVNFSPCEALDNLAEVIGSAYFGCVHFNTAPPSPNTAPCGINTMLLIYTPEKQQFLGFIPNKQLEFVEHLRDIILHRPDEELSQIHPSQILPMHPH